MAIIQTATNAGRESQGRTILGLQINQIWPFFFGLLGAVVAVFFGIILGVPLFPLLGVSALAPILSLGWVLYFVRGRPPHFASDWFTTRLFGARAFTSGSRVRYASMMPAVIAVRRSRKF